MRSRKAGGSHAGRQAAGYPRYLGDQSASPSRSRLGVDLPTLKELMGHSEISTTLRYFRPTPDHKLEALKKLHEFKTGQVFKEQEAKGVLRKVSTVREQRHAWVF